MAQGRNRLFWMMRLDVPAGQASHNVDEVAARGLPQSRRDRNRRKSGCRTGRALGRETTRPADRGENRIVAGSPPGWKPAAEVVQKDMGRIAVDRSAIRDVRWLWRASGHNLGNTGA